MSSFAGDIQAVCLATFGLLGCYTLFLSRYRGLDSHLTVRWLLILGAAFLTITFWPLLPFFKFTSSLQERELLLMVTVLMFAFVILLMLDLLVRTSRQTQQIKRLTQELAIQRARLDDVRQDDYAPAPEIEQPLFQSAPKSASFNFATTLSLCWIILCIGGSWAESSFYNSTFYPTTLKRLVSAAFQE